MILILKVELINTFTADDDHASSYVVGNTQPMTTRGCHKCMGFFIINKIFGY